MSRQRQDGFWCTLAGPKGVDESGNLSLKLSHQHVLPKQQEWLFAWAMLGKALCNLPHHTGYSDIYTYHYACWGVKGNRPPLPRGPSDTELLTYKILPHWFTEGRLTPFIQWMGEKDALPVGEPVLSSRNISYLGVRSHPTG